MPVSQAYQGIADIAFSGLKGERPAPKAGALPTAQHPDIKFFQSFRMYSQTKRATNFAIPGYLLSIAQLSADGKRKFSYINEPDIGGRMSADVRLK